MKSPKIILVVLLMATAVCCWLSVLSLRHARIRVVDLSAFTSHTAVFGIISDPDFLLVLKALEQRAGVSKLTEPEVFTRHGLGPVNRMYYDQKFTFLITNQ
ncbi:MAG: hypothetical protein WCS94_21075 [Verrucomicrobiota bacterium]